MTQKTKSPADKRTNDAWNVANGHTAGPNLRECYVAGPESNSDEAMWRTELNRPLLG